MKVTGKQTIVQNVEVDISDEEIMNIVKAQTPDYLADVLTKELLRNFIYSLPADFTGERAVWETRKRGYEQFLVLVHVDAGWDHHNNVGVDEEVRPLTEEETVKYNMICGLRDYIKHLQK